MTEQKALPTLAVATLTTGICLVEGFAGVGEAANWIMGHLVWTHELGPACERIREIVKARYPDFPMELGDGADWQKVREDVLDRYGAEIAFERGSEVRTASPEDTLPPGIEVIVVDPTKGPRS